MVNCANDSISKGLQPAIIKLELIKRQMYGRGKLDPPASPPHRRRMTKFFIKSASEPKLEAD